MERNSDSPENQIVHPHIDEETQRLDLEGLAPPDRKVLVTRLEHEFSVIKKVSLRIEIYVSHV
jgi:hypothetical protein